MCAHFNHNLSAQKGKKEKKMYLFHFILFNLWEPRGQNCQIFLNLWVYLVPTRNSPIYTGLQVFYMVNVQTSNV